MSLIHLDDGKRFPCNEEDAGLLIRNAESGINFALFLPRCMPSPFKILKRGCCLPTAGYMIV